MGTLSIREDPHPTFSDLSRRLRQATVIVAGLLN
jgi:hypothetical protein